jgi:Cu2+-exporting ATPase
VTIVAWLAAGAEVAYAVERLVTVLVIACPHALGLAVPLVIAISTTLGARSGPWCATAEGWKKRVT